MKTVVIAGGTGATGTRLAEQLTPRFSVLRLGSGTELLRQAEAEAALAGAAVAVYLASASRPHARLVQARREDLELLMADCFARAAERCGVRKLIVWRCDASAAWQAPLRHGAVPLEEVSSAEALLPAVEGVAAAGAGDRLLALRPPPSRSVCSVQRLPLPPGWTANQAARAYFSWVKAHLPGVGVEAAGDAWTLKVLGAPLLCLSSSPGRSRPHSAVLSVGGGWLNFGGAGRGWFEFRVVRLESGPQLFSSLTGFTPALPWPLYRATQALFHGWVMARFGRWLARQ